MRIQNLNLLNNSVNLTDRGIAEINADSVEKFRISKAHEINTDPEKLTQIPKKKPLQNGKKVIVLGDSMLWHQKPHILSKSGNKVNIKFYPGATTEDITDHLRPAMRKKPDAIIIHTGTNDLTNDVNTMKNVRSLTKIIEEMHGGGDIEAGFSGVIERRDHDLSEKSKDINERLKRFSFTDISMEIFMIIAMLMKTV